MIHQLAMHTPLALGRPLHLPDQVQGQPERRAERAHAQPTASQARNLSLGEGDDATASTR